MASMIGFAHDAGKSGWVTSLIPSIGWFRLVLLNRGWSSDALHWFCLLGSWTLRCRCVSLDR